MYLYMKGASAALLLLLLLGVVLHHSSRAGWQNKKCCWVIEFDFIQSSVFFLFIQTRFISNVCTPSQHLSPLRPQRCLHHILGNYESARSQGGSQPASVKPPLSLYVK